MRSALIGVATIAAALTAGAQSGSAQESFFNDRFCARGGGAESDAFPDWFVPSLSGSLPLMMPGGSNHRCRDFYTWELRRGQPIQERS